MLKRIYVKEIQNFSNLRFYSTINVGQPFVTIMRKAAYVIFLSLFGIVHIERANGVFQGHVEASRSSEDGMEVWGYSEVRKGAHMFWWLFYSIHPNGSDTRPLIIWLQGGPGLSSSGTGNLALIGPLDEHLLPRNDTWVYEANLLFVDSPIDVGFSYVDSGTLLAQNSDEIAADLISMLNSVMSHLPHLKNMTVYIFGQSYGGKLAAVFAYHLLKAIENKEITVSLKGVALGNAWISPVDTTLNWAPLLLHMSVIDQFQFAKLDRMAQDFAREWENCGARCNSTVEKSFTTHEELHKMGGGMNTYNLGKYYSDTYSTISLVPEQMNGVVKRKLHIIPDHIIWKRKSYQVFETLKQNDFFSSEVYKVDWLLERDIEVIIYQGQLDIICPTNGAQDWLNKLKWKKFPLFYQSPRQPLLPPGGREPEMFVKAHENLKFYWVLKAGHAVPRDTPGAALRMLSHIIKNQHIASELRSQSDRQHASKLLMIVQILTIMTIFRAILVTEDSRGPGVSSI